MGRIERGAITPMDRNDVPPALLAVLRKGMAVDRTQRYSTAVDFARALQAIELSLSYTPTQIDVPNLAQVDVPVRPAGDDHADATRARGVTPVIAQPPRPSEDPVDRTRARGATVISPIPPATPVASPQLTAAQPEASIAAASTPVDATVVRRSSRSVVSPDGSAHPAGEAGENAPSRRRLGVVWSVIIGVLVVAAVISAVALFAPRDSPGALKTGSTGGASINVATAVPPPVLGTATLSADRTTASFTWTDHNAVKGDSYIWQRTDGAGGGDVTPTTQPQATITGVSPGTTVCIQVSIVRSSGEVSANPLKACTS
ncbi:MAG: hypothetical protein QOH57_3009, partial [Mycobacterium sp.]|nr:hypothetical protein [Mycobacterium sp.]